MSILPCDPNGWGHLELLGRHFLDSSCQVVGVHEHRYEASSAFSDTATFVLRFEDHAACSKYSVSHLMLLAEYDRITRVGAHAYRHRERSAAVWIDHLEMFEAFFGTDLIPLDLHEAWAMCSLISGPGYREAHRFRVSRCEAGNNGHSPFLLSLNVAAALTAIPYEPASAIPCPAFVCPKTGYLYRCPRKSSGS